MDVSISKRVMPLFGLLCAGALMWASALFCPNAALAQPAEASDSARIYILPFEYMDAILIESDGHFGMVDSGAIRQTAPIRAIPFGRTRLLAMVSKIKLPLSCKAWV